jgi:transcriptional antiterminator
VNKCLAYQSEILEILTENSPVSAKFISKEIKLSEKTVRGKVDQIDLILQEKKLGHVEKSPGKGITLIVNPRRREAFNQFLAMKSGILYDTEEDLLLFLLKMNNQYITQAQLANEFFCSIPTIRKNLDTLENSIKEYDLRIEAVKRKGIRVIGREQNIRLLIKNRLLENSNGNLSYNLKLMCPGVDVEKVKEIIKKVESDWKIQFSRNLLNRLWISICLSITRKNSNDISISEQFRSEYENEINVANSIYLELKKKKNVHFSKKDGELLALEIASGSKILWNKNFVEEKTDIDEFTKKIIRSISIVLKVNLSDDVRLQKDLSDHLKSAVFRMKYGEKISSSITKKIKLQFPKVFLAIWSTSTMFEKAYNVQITENEISYVALYIETAIMRRSNNIHAVYITNHGKSQSLFIAELIKKNIPEINSIEVYRKYEELNEENLRKLIISDIHFDNEKVIEINSMPSIEDFEKIREAIVKMGSLNHLKVLFSSDVQSMFDPELMFLNVKSQTKEAILKKVIDKLETTGSVTKRFYQSVLAREMVTSTSIGNRTAIPHGNTAEVNESKIAVVTLREPIKWFGNEEVRLIFILATRMNSEQSIIKTRTFFTNLIDFTENEKQVQNFLAISDTIEGYKFLFS